MDGQEDIVLIVLAIEKRLEPERTELLIEGIDLPFELRTETLIIFGRIKLNKLS